MILRPEQILLMRLGLPTVPANGGGSESDSSTSSSTQNTNFVTTEDRRVVASDAAVAVSGNNNVASRTENTSFTDSSTKDSGNSTSITNTTTDFGSVSKALEGVTTMGKSAVGLADNSVMGAIDVLKAMSDNNTSLTMKAFELARNSSADSARTVENVSAFANKNSAMAKEAFSESTLGRDDNKTVLYAGLAVIGAVGAALAMKKG
jgi:hypothetical protein